MDQDKKPNLPMSGYLDRPEITETFADHLENTQFVDGLVKLTMSATRWPQSKQGEQAISERATTLRLVLPGKTAIDLVNALNQLMGALVKEGIIKHQGPLIKEAAPNELSK